MKFSDSTKNTVRLAVGYLFIVLFVYASVSKLLEFQDFQTQLGQSPLLGSYAEIVSYSVILIELLASVLLAIDKYRKLGLYISFTLMVMFTAYIIIILNFTTFTPCSCGGVLESLGWTEHLIFNIAFILLALISVYEKSALKLLIVLFVSGILFVTIVFLLSENEIKRNNGFIRKYIPHGLEKIGEYQLESNSFYIAGIDEKTIYLGNINAPLYLKLISNDLKFEKQIKIDIEKMELPYRRVKVLIHPPYFFLADGTVPIIFRGNINNWNGKVFSHDDAYFLQYIVMDSINIGIATNDGRTNQNTLGKISMLNDTVHLSLSTSVLKKQVDGTFDTDGMLLWNNEQRKFVYLYYYRNQYELADENLNFISSGKTIDTISRAQLDVAHYQKTDQYKLGKSVIINRYASTYNKNLFITNDRLGKYEEAEILKYASVIDQYDINSNTYVQSFYFYHQPGEKLREFVVFQDLIFGLVDDKLWVYRIERKYYN